MRRSKIIAINAILAALILIFSLIPLVPIGVNLAVLTLIPVFIAGQIAGIKSAVFAGFFLGIISLISSFIMPTPIAPLFRNPIISVLPRIMVGIVSWLVYGGMTKIMKKTRLKPALSHTISSTVSAGLAVVTNTGLVLAMIWAFYNGQTVGDTAITAEFMMTLVSVNFVIELIGGMLITPPISLAVRKSLHRTAG